MNLIERQAAIDALNEYFARIGRLKRRGLTKGEKAINLDTVGAIKTLPSAEPVRKLDEWCTDCKEYDHDKHCCPRFNRVIWSALQDAEIVRCRDCKWKNKHHCTRAVELYIHDNDFCSWAERRTENADVNT